MSDNAKNELKKKVQEQKDVNFVPEIKKLVQVAAINKNTNLQELSIRMKKNKHYLSQLFARNKQIKNATLVSIAENLECDISEIIPKGYIVIKKI